MTELTNVCNRVSLNTINQTVKIPSMRANPEGIPLWTLKEDKTNKVTSLNSQSTDTQYPSAKCVYDIIQSTPGIRQQQADWNQTDTEAVDFIKNKPTIPVVPTDVSAFTNDAGYITINDVPAQEQADWNQTNTSAVDFIKNKPTIPSAQINSDWNSSSGVSEILNKPDLTLKEDTSNKVTSISSSSTDTEYPSAKCVYDAIQAGVSSGNVSSYFLSGTNPINVDATGMEIGDLRIYTVYIANDGSVTISFSVDSGKYAYGAINYGVYENYNVSNVTSITYVKQAIIGNSGYYQINIFRIS